MGDLFEEYRRHLTGLLFTLENKLKTCEQGALEKAATQRQNLEQLRKTLSAADETVRQLELEARASYGDVAATRLDEIRRIKLELKKASNRSKVMQMELERTELLGSGRAETNVGSHYSQLQENDKLLQKGYEYLQTSCAMAQETEMIGAGAAEELYQQRNAIYNVQSDVKKTRISIKEADEYLTKLLKQGRLNTFVMRVVFAGIGLAVLIIAVSRTLRMFL